MMRTIPIYLRKGDTLADGGVVESAPIDHETYTSVVVRYDNGERRIRDLPRLKSIHVTRARGATFGPTGQGLPLEDDRARRAADDYERRLGL